MQHPHLVISPTGHRAAIEQARPEIRHRDIILAKTRFLLALLAPFLTISIYFFNELPCSFQKF